MPSAPDPLAPSEPVPPHGAQIFDYLCARMPGGDVIGERLLAREQSLLADLTQEAPATPRPEVVGPVVRGLRAVPAGKHHVKLSIVPEADGAGQLRHQPPGRFPGPGLRPVQL